MAQAPPSAVEDTASSSSILARGLDRAHATLEGDSRRPRR